MSITLKAARVNEGLTQREAASILNISKNTLASYEKYQTKPDIEMAKKMAALYKRSINDLKFFAD